MPDVYIEFHGDADDSVRAAEELIAVLETIRALAVQVTEALSEIKIGPSVVSRFVADAKVMEGALADVEDQANETQRALAGLGGAGVVGSMLGTDRGVIQNVDRRVTVNQYAASRSSSGSDAGLLAAAGWSGGGGRRGFGWGPWGWAAGAAMGGFPHARFGTPLALMGLDAMRLGGSALGIAGSAVGGLGIGGGLYGLGILGTGAVGMGTDLAGIGQAAGDIKKTTQAYDQLQQAIAIYGRSSTEAKNAQAQLNYTLQGFPAVARAAVLQASVTGQSFKALFDRFTGPAEKTGAQIITQGMQTAMPFLPVIGRYAAENMKIIQQGLQPLFSWLDSKKGGLGIFTQLEQLFQNRLPTAVHAGTQGFELFAHAVLDAANRTGNLLPKIDEFLTKLNTPSGLKALDTEIGHMMGLFQAWAGLFGSIIRGVWDLFKPAVSLGKDFAVQLTSIVNKFREWLNLGSTQNTLHALFAAHKAQMDAIFSVFQALLPLAESFLTVLLKVEATIARFTVGPIKAIADIINAITKIPFASTVIGWGAALALIYKGANMLFVRMVDGAKVSADSMAGITAATNLTTAAVDRLNVSLLGMGPAAAKGAAEADAAIATEGAVGKTSLLGALGLGGVGARGGALLGGLKGGFTRILPGAIVGGIGGSIASSIVTPYIHNRTGASIAGNVLQYGGLGAGIGSVVPGLGTGLGAAAGAAVGLGVSLLTLSHHADAASQRMAAFANDARDAGSRIRGAHQTIQQTGVSLANDKVARDQAAQQLATDRRALEQTKKGTTEYAAALDQLRADQVNYGQTVRQVSQDERTLTSTHKQLTVETQRQKDAQANLRKELDATAEKFRTQAQNMSIGAARLAEFGSKTSLADQRTQGFIARMQDLAAKTEATNPKLAQTYTNLAVIAKNMNAIPTAKEIAVTLKFGYDLSGLAGVIGSIGSIFQGIGAVVGGIGAHLRQHGGVGPRGLAPPSSGAAPPAAPPSGGSDGPRGAARPSAPTGSTDSASPSASPVPQAAPVPAAAPVPQAAHAAHAAHTHSGARRAAASSAASPALPLGLQFAIDKAATTTRLSDDLNALYAAVAWVQDKIRKLTAAHASLKTLDAYYQMLSGLQGQLSGLGGARSASRISDLSAGHSALAKIAQALHGNLLGGAQAISPADIMGVHTVASAHATWDPKLEGWRKQLRGLDKELRDKTISQETADTIRARIDAITKHITSALTALKDAAQTQLQAATTAWSSFMSAFDASYSSAGSDSSGQLDAARTQLGKDQLAVSLDSAQSGVLGGTADTSMAQKVINDMQTVLAGTGGTKQPYTQAQIDNWLGLWGDYYAKQGYTPQQMYEAFNALLTSVGLPTIDNPFDTGGLPLPPDSGGGSGPPGGKGKGPGSPFKLGLARGGANLTPNTATHHGLRVQHTVHHSSHTAGGATTVNVTTKPHVEIRFEKGLEWLDKHVTVLVDGEIRKQGEKANARARSGRR